jgi:hypothetical protein
LGRWDQAQTGQIPPYPPFVKGGMEHGAQASLICKKSVEQYWFSVGVVHTMVSMTWVWQEELSDEGMP